MYKQRCKEVSIRSFSRYVQQNLAWSATDVTLQYDPRQDSSIRWKQHDVQHVYHIRLAFIFKEPEHRAKDCSEFRREAVEKRWKTIQQLNAILQHLWMPAPAVSSSGAALKGDLNGCQASKR